MMCGTFNRTTVECKLQSTTVPGPEYYTFNRTTVECKSITLLLT